MKPKYIKIISVISLFSIIFSFVGCNRRFVPGEEAVSVVLEAASETDILAELNASMRCEHISQITMPTETTTEEQITEPYILEEEPEPIVVPEPEEEYYDDLEDDYIYEDHESYHGSYAGTFELTAYEWTGYPMANGEYPYYGACASNYFALGTVLYIEGYGTFVVKDRGGMADNVIDIYLGDPDACWEFGRKFGVKVYYG